MTTARRRTTTRQRALLMGGLLLCSCGGTMQDEGAEDDLGNRDLPTPFVRATNVSATAAGGITTPTAGLWPDDTLGYDIEVPERCRATKRFVARLKGTTCAVPASLPRPGRWSATPVFPSESNPAVRNAFCQFEWVGAGSPTNAAVAELAQKLAVYDVQPIQYGNYETREAGPRDDVRVPDLRPQCPPPPVVTGPSRIETRAAGARSATTFEPQGGGVIRAPGNDPVPNVGRGTCGSCTTTGNAQIDQDPDGDLPIGSGLRTTSPSTTSPRTTSAHTTSGTARAAVAIAYVALPASAVRPYERKLVLWDEGKAKVLAEVTIPPYAQNVHGGLIEAPTPGTQPLALPDRD